METTGACFCEAIAYRVDLDLQRIGICHCRDCQILSGSAFRLAALVSPASFQITKGEPKAFDKKAESGRVRRLLFCGDCGSHLASLPSDPGAAGAFVSLRIATSKDFASLKPTHEIWCGSKVSWMPDLAGTRRFEGQP